MVQNSHKLFPDSFWLVTNLDPKHYKPEDLFAAYRRRGKAERHIGEFKDVLRPSLSSCDRPKTSYAGRALESCVEKKQIDGVHPHNETLFLFNLFAYQIVHTGRCLMEEGTRKGWSIRRFRERFLLAASRVVRHSRYVCFIISSSAAPYWNTLWRRFDRLRWVGGAGINSSTSGAEKKKREKKRGGGWRRVTSGVCPNTTKSPAEAVFLRTAARIVHENPLSSEIRALRRGKNPLMCNPFTTHE